MINSTWHAGISVLLCTNISWTSLQLLQPYFQQITLHLHLLSFQPYYRETVIIIIVYCISVYLLGRRLANLSFFCISAFILEHWGLRCILHYCQRSARKCIETYFVYFVMYAIFSVLIVSNLFHSLTQKSELWVHHLLLLSRQRWAQPYHHLSHQPCSPHCHRKLFLLKLYLSDVAVVYICNHIPN